MNERERERERFCAGIVKISRRKKSFHIDIDITSIFFSVLDSQSSLGISYWIFYYGTSRFLVQTAFPMYKKQW